MTRRYDFALGIDTGPTTGIALLHLAGILAPDRLGDCAEVYQCNARQASWLLAMILGRHGINGAPARGGIEAIVTGNGPAMKMRAGRQAIDQVEELSGIAAGFGVVLAARNAGTVKPWAERNDWKRLRAAGLYDLACGMPHALSALGQALYCAVLDCGMRDPLSRAERSG